MNANTSFELLAAMTDAGVALHDIIGGCILAVLLVIGIVFYKRSNWHVRGSQPSSAAKADRKFAKLQIWILYLLAVGAVIAFFFMWPRAESRIEQPSLEENAKGQKL